MKGYEVMGKKLHCIQRKPETDSRKRKAHCPQCCEGKRARAAAKGAGGTQGWNRCQVPSQHQRQEMA